ncbi:winged helix-turn-helix domain-containing protein, partial [Candidatus Bipolaricaulota bacterium]|nr:winged helix-turn-helix domain-containing protein [Candidatus Bipolaricaulota bacterium]
RAFGQETPDGWDIGLELPRAELAEMAGVSTETAIRVLSDLKDRDILGLPGRRIVIKRREDLENLAHPFRTFLRENLA